MDPEAPPARRRASPGWKLRLLPHRGAPNHGKQTSWTAPIAASANDALLLVILCVRLNEVLPVLRRLIQCKNGLNRTRGDTCPTVDAFVRMDVQHLRERERRLVIAGVDAVHGTHVKARGALVTDASRADDIRHVGLLAAAQV